MPRIAREEPARIRERVEVGGEKVAAVAASYGCTPANIYAILAKLRHAGEAPAAPLSTVPEDQPATAVLPVQPVEAPSLGNPEPAEAVILPLIDPLKVPVTAPPEPPAVSAAARSASQGRGTSSAPRGGRSGYALLMRADDGEEAVNPFRSLDELLAAAKPILRNAARSPEPVWFSIQPVDLDALEDAL